MDAYPVSKTKIDLLIGSIKKTGFWDNILARKNNGNIELAYGHHRLFALLDKESGYGKESQIDIPIKDISDDDMLRIMADENMDEYSPEPRVINETVKAIRDHLCSRTRNQVTAQDIYAFMGHGWSLQRIEFATKELELIENNVRVLRANAIGKMNKEWLPIRCFLSLTHHYLRNDLYANLSD